MEKNWAAGYLWELQDEVQRVGREANPQQQKGEGEPLGLMRRARGCCPVKECRSYGKPGALFSGFGSHRRFGRRECKVARTILDPETGKVLRQHCYAKVECGEGLRRRLFKTPPQKHGTSHPADGF